MITVVVRFIACVLCIVRFIEHLRAAVEVKLLLGHFNEDKMNTCVTLIQNKVP